MAETLLGDHRGVLCADCGRRFNCGVDRTPPPRAVCPNCGYPDNDLQTSPDIEGERLLIDRAAFQLRRPRRWEIAALLSPARADAIAVKRIVGLPGEAIEIRRGDVYVDGEIRRKDLAEQRALAVPVHDAAHRPTRDPAQAPLWRADNPESRWTWSKGRFAHPLSADREPIDWLVYHHGRRGGGGQSHFRGGQVNSPDNVHSAAKIGTVPNNPDAVSTFVESPVADLYGYNQSRPRREEDVHAVADLMLSLRLIRNSGQGTFYIRATDGGERFEARLRFDGDRPRFDVLRGDDFTAIAAGAGTVPIFAATGALSDIPTSSPRKWDRPPGIPLLVEASLIDRQFLLAVEGRTIARQQIQRSGPAEPTATPLAIGVRGLGATVEDLRVFRDVYYTAPIGLARPGPVRLGRDEYYVLGDNSPISEDSRCWPDGGAVKANLLVGKPLAAIPSVRFAPFSAWSFSVPKPSGIRYIH